MFFAFPCAHAQDFFFDPSFGGTGRVITSISTGDGDRGSSLVMRPDGKIIAAARRGIGGGNNGISVLRFKQDGTLDSTFSMNGIASINVGQSCFPDAVAQQADGKILVGGTTYHPTNFNDLLLARLNADGSTDATFANNGSLAITSPAAQDHITALHTMSDGRFLAMGQFEDAFIIMRLLDDGSFDPTFGIAGRVPIHADTIFSGRGLAVQTDGKILIAGSSLTFQDTNYSVVRLNTDGTFDSSFGNGGIVRSIDPAHFDDVFNLRLLADGRILLVGVRSTLDLQHFSVLIRRANADGTWDNSFGTNSLTLLPIAGSNVPNANDIVISASGKLFMANAITDSLTLQRSVQFVRLSADGIPDPTFGNGGVLTWTCDGSPGCELNDLIVQGDGRITGIGTIGQVNSTDVLTVRLFPDAITRIDEATRDESSLTIHPNPASDWIEVHGDAITIGRTRMELRDATGRIACVLFDGVRSPGSIAQRIALPSHLTNGAYVLVITTASGIATTKLVVAR